MNLTVGDGFKFGCGGVLAVAFAVVVLLLLVALAVFISSLMGRPLPVPLT
jgi:Flp pilus assembly protein TadG